MSYDQMFYGGIIASVIIIIALLYVWIKWDILQVFKDIIGMHGQKNYILNRQHRKSQTSGRLMTVTSDIQLRPNEQNKNSNQHSEETEMLQQSNVETTMLQDEKMDETTILTDTFETTLLHNDESMKQNVWLEMEKGIVVVHAKAIENEEGDMID